MTEKHWFNTMLYYEFMALYYTVKGQHADATFAREYADHAWNQWRKQ